MTAVHRLPLDMRGDAANPPSRMLMVEGGPRRHLSWLSAAFLVSGVALLASLVQPEIQAEFAVVTALCGVLAGVDAFDWILRRKDTFDPVGLVGAYGVFFFFLAPLYQVMTGYWPKYVPAALDSQNALTVIGYLNLVGLAIYRLLLAYWPLRVRQKSPTTSRNRFRKSLVFVSLISVGSYVLLVASFGGPASYYSALFTGGQGQSGDALEGLGPLVTVAAWFPLTIFAAYVVHRACGTSRTMRWTLPAAAMFSVMLLAVDGLRGSRGSFVWPVLIAVGMVHYVVRPVSRIFLLALALSLLTFMFVYGIYKSNGVEGLARVSAGESVVAVADESGRGVQALVLGDFGRTTTQSLVVEAIRWNEAFSPSLGVTYLGDVIEYLPGDPLPWLSSKSEAGTDALYGVGTADAGFRSSLIFGMSGEGMLNFGWLGAILPYFAWVLVARWATRVKVRWTSGGDIGSGISAPALALSAVYFLFNDFDNFTRFVLSYVVPILLAVWISRVAIFRDTT